MFHDDQHGTAIVVLAALINALHHRRQAPRGRPHRRASASAPPGTAVSQLLLQAGAGDVVGVDRGGILSVARPVARANAARWRPTPTADIATASREALAGADVFIGSVGGPSTPPLVKPHGARIPSSSRWPIPSPEVQPEAIEGVAAVIATGRSDYPNQINNVLCFPGFFRGAARQRRRQITDGHEAGGGRAIAAVVGDDLHPEYIIPSVFNRDVAPAVAAAVSDEAIRAGSRVSSPTSSTPAHGAVARQGPS